MLSRRHFLSHLTFSSAALLAWERIAPGEEPIGASEKPPVEGNINFPTVTGGGKQFWSDELVFHRWRIQLNVISGHYRLLDENDYRHAWGTFDQCREKLATLQREKTLPPMNGRAVLTLHGLFRSRDATEGLGQYLEEEADFTWLNVGYASTRRSIDDHAASLAKVLEHLDGIDEVHFVCHSLGNLVVRRYLGEALQPEPRWKTDPRLKRMVMLGPPNQGAHMAEIFKNNKVFGLVMGPSGKQLAGGWTEVEKRLATPQFDFGIIAGNLKTTNLYNPLVVGDDDFVVGIEETRLDGARDFMAVPLHHGQLLHDKQVREYVRTFLCEGCFISDEKRQPLAKQPQPDGRK